MQKRLALARPTEQIAALAIALDLAHMPADGAPAADLPAILLGQAATHVITAIPLEPATRILGMDPALAPPLAQLLAGVDTEIIELGIAFSLGEFGAGEPV